MALAGRGSLEGSVREEYGWMDRGMDVTRPGRRIVDGHCLPRLLQWPGKSRPGG